MSIRKVNIRSSVYPKNLKTIYRPPTELYINGTILPSDCNAVAIVGTRRATHYGMEQARKFAYDLALRGITIISGMARGIDTAAHRGAIAAGGRTIAILGSGHKNIYPPENKKLYGEIARNGAVVSEYTADTPPIGTNFPKRNRIISGMSKGVLVIEAPIKSGALITADFALNEGREVFAMPGNISSVKSSGTNRLIKEGAKLAESIEDVLEELKLTDLKPPTPKSQSPKDGVSVDEKTIYSVLDKKPKSVDEISDKIDLPVRHVSQILLRLELKRLVKALPGENFVRV
ncbi:DNA-processing protein DprA [Candidatus Omnitrophota bacterium]